MRVAVRHLQPGMKVQGCWENGEYIRWYGTITIAEIPKELSRRLDTEVLYSIEDGRLARWHTRKDILADVVEE